MEFDMHKNTIHFTTYSPLLDKYAGRNGEYTFKQAPEFSDFTLPMPVQVMNAAHVPQHRCEQVIPPGHDRDWGRQLIAN